MTISQSTWRGVVIAGDLFPSTWLTSHRGLLLYIRGAYAAQTWATNLIFLLLDEFLLPRLCRACSLRVRGGCNLLEDRQSLREIIPRCL